VTEKNNETVKTVGVPIDIRTGHLPNSRLEHWSFSQFGSTPRTEVNYSTNGRHVFNDKNTAGNNKLLVAI
jgi:hypothetical protein